MSLEQRQSDRYREGAEACRAGHPVTDCPYQGQEREDWLAGWREHLRERMDAQQRAAGLRTKER